jgi:tripeptide aminopeptidase
MSAFKRERLETVFYDLLAIKGVGYHEKPVADYLQSHFTTRSIAVEEDNAGKEVDGDSGNLIVRIPGKGKGASLPGLCILTHMDTVKFDGEVKFRTDENRIVWADNSPILGGDDRAGIAIVLELCDVLRENGADHPPVVLVFTIAEECGLIGANHLDIAKLGCNAGFVLDCSQNPGTIIVQAPYSVGLVLTLKGHAAHAGIHPERGISALTVLAEALSHLRMGRIDEETTANWGVIKGGKATNIVMPELSLTGEIRSLNQAKLEQQLANIREELDKAVAKYTINRDTKPDYNLEVSDHYYSFCLTEKDLPVQLAMKAVRKLGMEPVLRSWGGGSDANVLNHFGLPTVNLAIGMDDVHGPREHISLYDLEKVVDILQEIAAQAANM